MPEPREASFDNLRPAQARALCELVELEACWENLRKTPAPDATVKANRADLLDRQKAYDAFHASLIAYNKEYQPKHIPELLLNKPSRLGIWCRRMRELHLLVQHDAKCRCPISVVSKAYWWADRISLRLHKPPVSRSTPPATMEVAIQSLEALSRWCDDLDATSGRVTHSTAVGADPSS